MTNVEQRKEAFANLVEIIDTLREACPWDKKQTMSSLRSLTIEEVHELADAVARGDLQEVKKELGDLIMHVVFYARIGEETGTFDITDVLQGICEKLRYRHPHVYGDVAVTDEHDVSRNWEQLKLKEKGRERVLEGVPPALPAMIKAYRVQEKARGVGFDWKRPADAWEKVTEELNELQQEIDRDDRPRVEAEFGDLLFSIINVARLHDVNPENALEIANKKFIRRFNHIEERARAAGRPLPGLSLEEMDALWKEAKELETK
ncbi:MAG: nucleoside triphosphate pyrophosphohydrolase [Odoribacteraceae bacterium]|jgi:XTP/dITP diphosphohydrolase|nr:nucleoside triphosphate pyrophosphohydrolase [Odoribacteraceae bacterium]